MNEDTQQKIQVFVEAIDKKIRQELKDRCEAMTPDFGNPEFFSVATALLSRQATLAIELASAPQLWNGHSAPLFHRAMTDLHISLSWIVLEPKTRAKQYVEHSLGQAVLMLEHRKSGLETADDETKETLLKAIEAEEAWINAQKLSFMVEVNVGAWSGKTTRAMADEAGILPFYNYVYTPFSQCAHSTWYHISRYNSQPSDSPMSRLLWKPVIGESSSDVWNLNLSAKYLDKTFNLFDEKVLGRAPASVIQDWIYDEIQNRFQPKSSP